MLSSSDIRQQFIRYFHERHSHTMVPSSPVVPHEDPTLLFANAGMNQFKDVFLGTGHRPYTRAVNTQKCIRAGGKHNDLEDVGKDTYHHTFFEMLGNWSFGDYFKKEAIAWAWELLTDVWGMDKSRLYVTVFAGDPEDNLDRDNEAAELWTSVTDIEPTHIHFGSKKDNFWEMGDTGPCGPCSEIHIDLTPDKSGAALVNAGDPRVIEIWNLVFIQFNRNAAGLLTPLPHRHVDTGMGFERLTAVLQGKTSNYDTDVFAPLFAAIGTLAGAKAYDGKLNDPVDMAYRVIADHIRCLTFALTDGAVPSNEGRGYVLRRILRRAFRHGRQTFDLHEPFLHKLVPAVVATMGEAFPELRKEAADVAAMIEEEEASFGRTIDRGIELFDIAASLACGKAYCAEMGGKLVEADADSFVYEKENGTKERMSVEAFPSNVLVPSISANDAFKLYDTYGFPLDLTQVMAQERGMAVDVKGFDELMAEARARSRATASGADQRHSLIEIVQQHKLPATTFAGYDRTTMAADTLIELFAHAENNGYAPAKQLSLEMHGAVVVEQTPFYAEAGGQVGDRGVIETDNGIFEVEDTLKVGDAYFHLGKVTRGTISTSGHERVMLSVDENRRQKIMANHTGTHLLNFALRDVLGDHIQQRGSLVDQDRLRFDFSHGEPLKPKQIERIETIVNEQIAEDRPVYAEQAPQDEALKIHGLRAVFGEKYPPKVRIVSIGAPVNDLLAEPKREAWRGYSIEFCGGTHLPTTGDAEGFVILSEEAVGKGVRRITALTGAAAHQAQAQAEALLHRMDALRQAQGSDERDLPTDVTELVQAVLDATLPLTARTQLNAGIGDLQQILRDIEKERSKEAMQSVVEDARKIAEEADGDLIVAHMKDADGDALRTAMDVIRKKHPEAALLLTGVSGDKVAIVAAVPESKIKKGLKAGDWVREVAKVVGGGGGGRPDMAQAGGKDPAKIPAALQKANDFAKAKI